MGEGGSIVRGRGRCSVGEGEVFCGGGCVLFGGGGGGVVTETALSEYSCCLCAPSLQRGLIQHLKLLKSEEMCPK